MWEHNEGPKTTQCKLSGEVKITEEVNWTFLAVSEEGMDHVTDMS